MNQYHVDVNHGEKGYDVYGNIFTVILEILKNYENIITIAKE